MLKQSKEKNQKNWNRLSCILPQLSSTFFDIHRAQMKNFRKQSNMQKKPRSRNKNAPADLLRSTGGEEQSPQDEPAPSSRNATLFLSSTPTRPLSIYSSVCAITITAPPSSAPPVRSSRRWRGEVRTCRLAQRE